MNPQIILIFLLEMLDSCRKISLSRSIYAIIFHKLRSQISHPTSPVVEYFTRCHHHLERNMRNGWQVLSNALGVWSAGSPMASFLSEFRPLCVPSSSMCMNQKNASTLSLTLKMVTCCFSGFLETCEPICKSQATLPERPLREDTWDCRGRKRSPAAPGFQLSQIPADSPA